MSQGSCEVRPEKDPPPEKYSLEWYVWQKELKEEAAANRAPVAESGPSPVEYVVAGALFCGFFALINMFF